jgi:neuropeptide S receptor 1
MSLIALTLFVLPAFIIAYCYAKIIRTIWSNGTYLDVSDKLNGKKEYISKNRASSRGIIPQAKVKSVKMTIVIVIVFISCWSPYIIFDLFQVFGMIPQTQSNFAIATLIQSLAPLNSAANPLIYLLFSNQIFQALV